MGNTNNDIENCESSEHLRLEPAAFTRRRQLSAKRLLHMVLERIYHSLQLHVDAYYDHIVEKGVSKQAFSKARQALNPEFVRRFADNTAKVAVSMGEIPRYRGMPLVAIDGSDIALENTEELKEAFGCSGPRKDAATALGSIAYGPLDHVIYDCRIDRYDCDERDLAKAHVKRLDELGMRGSLLLFDRWYPSAAFIAFLYESGFHFVMRMRRKWNLEVDRVKTQDWITVCNAGKPYRVRVLKVTLPTGEVETLLTSLNQKVLPIGNAAALYFERWKAETAFDLLKSKLQLENFSGKTKVSVLQDFYATIYLANLVAFAAEEADALIAQKDAGKPLRHVRQANRNRTITKLRSMFICLLLEPEPHAREAMLHNLFSSIARFPVSVVPDRSPPRKIPRKKRFHMARKSVL